VTPHSQKTFHLTTFPCFYNWCLMFEKIDRHIPNILTALRVIAIPFFIICCIWHMPVFALFIFVFACLTDYFDGYLARKYNLVTDFGKIMDPIADKLLIWSALVILNIPPIRYIHWIVTVIIVLRDIVVTLARQHYQAQGIIIPARIFGKIKTTLQMIGIIACLTFYSAMRLSFLDFFHPFETQFILYLQVYFWLLALVTIASGIDIFIKPRTV